MANDENKKTSDDVVSAIAALKEKAESEESSEAKEGVDLLSIVKKLSRNREKTNSA